MYEIAEGVQSGETFCVITGNKSDEAGSWYKGICLMMKETTARKVRYMAHVHPEVMELNISKLYEDTNQQLW